MSARRFFLRARWEKERARELESYLEIEAEENLARGMSPDDARQAARRKLGNSTLIGEEIYHMNSIRFLETVWQDVRYAARTLSQSPAFTVVVIVSLALGIGANTAIFSFMDAVLLKMLPVRDPERLVQLKTITSLYGGVEEFSYPSYKDFRDRNRTFSGVVAFATFYDDPDVEVDGRSGLAKGQFVSGNYFGVLGIKPLAGRLIIPADEIVAGQSAVAVISYAYWRSRFALDPATVGKKIVLDNVPFTIIGITPPEFFGLQPGQKIDISIPITMKAQVNPAFADTGTRNDILAAPFRTWLSIMGRLKPGVSSKESLADLQPIFRASMREAAAAMSGLPLDSPAFRASILSSKLQLDAAGQGLAALRQQFSRPLWILMAGVFLLLLVTCGNVANLLLARANARQKEIAVRLTVGAGRWRLIRQFTIESLLLALGGGILGLLLAFLGDRSLLRLMSHSNPTFVLSVRPDPTVLGFTLLVSVFTSLLFGFLPAWRGTRVDSSALAETTRTVGVGGSRSRLGKMLIVSQVALSLVLLTGAGLLVRTLENLENFYPGFDKERILLFTVNPGVIGYNFDQSARLYKRLLDEIGAVPGVRRATFSFYGPLHMQGTIMPKLKEVSSSSGEAGKPTGIDEVGPAYFKTLETPVVAGRDFSTADRVGAPKVAIINEAMVRRSFPDTNPIGKHLTVPDWNEDASWKEIVGIVKDTKNRDLREPPVPMIYLPLFQFPDEGLITFEVRTATNPLSLAAAIERIIKTTESRLPVFDVKTMDQQVDDSLIEERLIASLSAVFGLLALLLASVGLYGLITYATNRRTGEIGIRIAVGATRGQIARMVLRESLLLVAVGISIGVPATTASSHLIQSELFGLRANDPLTIVMASLLMAGIAAFAAYLPARRASQVDPLTALRTG
ncbi:MAG: ABC transporter permease [Acidobacteriaceae bacterium]|nr:ABC transporter permease [Acidobacteriaceae bacterium]